MISQSIDKTGFNIIKPNQKYVNGQKKALIINSVLIQGKYFA
jgi:hypothetical protein